jgi:rhodanese-related sulfurtransferase
MAPEISPLAVKARLDAKQPLIILDVREDWEVNLCQIRGTLNIPMGDIPTAKEQLPAPDSEIIVMCHHGRRSQQVASWLLLNGYSNVLSMSGGIDQWAKDVDGSVGSY